jgi:DNA-directed RNA polymerase subunit RPC12/RpoP
MRAATLGRSSPPSRTVIRLAPVGPGVRVVFVGQDRVVWRRLVAYVLTLGVARRTWLYRVNKELDGHQALGLDHRLNALLLCLPVGGPSLVTWQTARRTARMLEGSGLPYGAAGWLWAATLVPILGNLFFIAWEQSRLNRFWAMERARPGHGIEVDVDLGSDPAFLVELGAALRESYHPGSRFDRRKRARRARVERARRSWAETRRERAAVRAAGGSTPVLPWLRPRPPEPRILHVTCGRCEARFDVRQDPLAETPLLCPRCGMAEVLPSLHSDPLQRREPAAVPAVKAKCPGCGTAFHAVRNLGGPTPLKCPSCGREETLPAPQPRRRVDASA